jgi:hypothetical protein
MTDGNMGGGILANALYDIGKVGIPNNMGKLAYIDENSNLFNYNSIKKENTYNVIQNYNSTSNDIPNTSYENATVKSCQDTCNNLNECGGFVFNKANNSCLPKTMKGSRQQDPNSDIYIREIIPKEPPIGIPEKTNYIDSVKFQNYLNGGSFEKDYGIAEINSVQQKQLEQLENKLNLLSSQITENTNKFNKGTQQAELQMNKNVKGLSNYLTDLNKTDVKVNNFNTNIDNILNDSDIIALQKNYEYLFWSILAVGAVLISMNVVKK